MPCYDISAEVTIRVLMELQVDAHNKGEAEAIAAAHWGRYPPMVSDGAVYDVQVDNINATRRKK